jgi:3-oxoacyl-[acyl-carrier-protein] synthase III
MSRLVNTRDKSAAALFGDAGTASLITARPDTAPSSFILGTNGKGFEKIIVPAGAFRQPKSEETNLETTDKDGNQRSPNDFYMDGGGVFAFSTQLAPRLVKEALAYAQLKLSDVDRFIFHQANKYIVSTIMRSLDLPLEKTPYDLIERYGNVSMASIPLALCDAPRQDNIPQTLLFSGFGVGLSWATAVLTKSSPLCFAVETYEAPST